MLCFSIFEHLPVENDASYGGNLKVLRSDPITRFILFPILQGALFFFLQMYVLVTFSTPLPRYRMKPPIRQHRSTTYKDLESHVPRTMASSKNKTTAQKRASTANRAATRRKKAAKDTAPAAARARAQPQPDDNDGGNDDDLDIDLVDAPGETPQEKRERVAFENDERRKEELHQAQLAAAYPSKQGYDEAYFLLNNYTFPQTNMSQFIKVRKELS